MIQELLKTFQNDSAYFLLRLIVRSERLDLIENSNEFSQKKSLCLDAHHLLSRVELNQLLIAWQMHRENECLCLIDNGSCLSVMTDVFGDLESQLGRLHLTYHSIQS